LTALRDDDVEAVREALEENPRAASDPLLETRFHGPPICAAVHLGCSPQIISLLLDYGANVNTTDLHGVPPLSILCSVPSWRSELAQGHLAEEAARSERRSTSVEKLLLASGADRTFKDESGRTAVELARAAGNDHLVQALT